MSGKKDVWLRLLDTTDRIANRTQVPKPIELREVSGDFYARQMRRLEALAGFLEEVERFLENEGAPAETEAPASSRKKRPASQKEPDEPVDAD